MKKNIKNSIINNIAIIVAFLILFIFFNISALKVYIDNEIRKNVYFIKIEIEINKKGGSLWIVKK